LARRSAVPVQLDLEVDRRMPESAAVAAYYVVAEALTNAAKHAKASQVNVNVEATAQASISRFETTDRGADSANGSGLIVLSTASRRSAERLRSPVTPETDIISRQDPYEVP